MVPSLPGATVQPYLYSSRGGLKIFNTLDLRLTFIHWYHSLADTEIISYFFDGADVFGMAGFYITAEFLPNIS